MPEGKIIKSLSGFYYIPYEGRVISCHARGKLKKNNIVPLVGDRAVFTLNDSSDGIIEEILPRKNSLIRPQVANIDSVIFVASNVIPVTDNYLIDKFSVIAEASGCRFVICVNKADIEESDIISKKYDSIGFKVIKTSTVTGEGIDELKNELKGKTSVISGNSGVGKSSIINKLIPDLDLQTDEVSIKLGRGKHTTRHVELFSVDADSYIIDTPGFSSFDVFLYEKLKNESLDNFFIDFSEHKKKCAYDDCRHINEPGCEVLDAVWKEKINRDRYESYKRMYSEYSSLVSSQY